MPASKRGLLRPRREVRALVKKESSCWAVSSGVRVKFAFPVHAPASVSTHACPRRANDLSDCVRTKGPNINKITYLSWYHFCCGADTIT